MLMEIVAGVLIFVIIFVYGGIHKVPEGHVGAYYQFGRLMKETSTPGLHFTWPLVTAWYPIQTTMQTDAVDHIPCGTKSGVMISFDRVEVVNRLRPDAVYSILSQYGTNYDKTWIYDKVHHEINQFCSANSLQDVYVDKFVEIDEIMQQALQDGCSHHAPGIDIIGVRVTKPKVPDSVLRHYETMEGERVKVMVAEQHQRLVTIESETKKKKELAEAEARRIVAETSIRQEIMEAEAKLNITRIENEMHLARAQQQAESNKILLTSEYLSLKWAEAIANTTKVYFGSSINGLIGGASQIAEAMASTIAGVSPKTTQCATPSA